MSKVIDKINVKKATDVDKISVKLKLGKPSLVNPIANLITISIDNCHFPKRFKEAQVVPLFKKKDPLTKSNYRPSCQFPLKNLKRYCLSNCLCILINNLICFCVYSARAMVAKQHY